MGRCGRRTPPGAKLTVPAQSRLLIVEDDPEVQGLMQALLQERGYRVTTVDSGGAMNAVMKQSQFDLVLLDLGLPDEDGLVLARWIRSNSDTPFVVMTARKGRSDRMAALKLGADDFITKPFDPAELMLRLENLLKRYRANDPGAGARILTFSGFSLDIGRRSLQMDDGSTVALTPSEFGVLSAMAKAKNRTLSRAFLLDATGGGVDAPGERIVDVIIHNLRKKLGDSAAMPRYIHTVSGVGYVFRPED